MMGRIPNCKIYGESTDGCQECNFGFVFTKLSSGVFECNKFRDVV